MLLHSAQYNKQIRNSNHRFYLSVQNLRCAAEKAAWAKAKSPTPTTPFQNDDAIFPMEMLQETAAYQGVVKHCRKNIAYVQLAYRH